MILIKYLHIGIDDTDSPDGMCTTYLACHIIDKLKEVGIEIVGYPAKEAVYEAIASAKASLGFA